MRFLEMQLAHGNCNAISFAGALHYAICEICCTQKALHCIPELYWQDLNSFVHIRDWLLPALAGIAPDLRDRERSR